MCPFTDNFAVLTYNANGLNSDVARGDREYEKHGLLLGVAVKQGVSFSGVQEPHGKLWDVYISLQRTAELRSFHFMGNLNPGGGGASAMYRSNVWEHVSGFSLSPKLMFVYLRQNSSSNLHHLPTRRTQQWLLIKQIIKNFQGHLELLSERKTIPGVDSRSWS